MNRLRNIGVVAHINAGKTTTTERILFHAGSTNIVGDVDHGNTITDYLIQERDRGITITSAAVSYNWKKHRINLIDTPGHVDFTVEVERSLSVIDGVITILDSSAGVEAQTITVWNQAKKYKLPNVVFLNKYDKPAANYKSCIEDLKECFDVHPCLIQLPIKGKKSNNLSILDVVRRNHLQWFQAENNYGSKYTSTKISDNQDIDKGLIDLAEKHRESLINVLTDYDDEFADHVVGCDKMKDVDSDMIETAMRRSTINCHVAPVILGSSFKYIGVQQLMDSIIKYLPQPDEREQFIRNHLENSGDRLGSQSSKKEAPTCGFIFKISHDPRLGPLNFVKICNGSLKKQQRLKIASSGQLEQVKRIYRAFADEMNEITEPIEKNDIVAISGLTQTRTGDILIDTNSNIKMDSEDQEQLNRDLSASAMQSTTNNSNELSEQCQRDDDVLPFRLLNQEILVPRIRQIDPVYYCSIESRNISQQLKLEHALACLSREDPSFRYEIDQHGLTTIRGMGKLHLEIIRDRIATEYKIDPLLGPLQISYRESIEGSAVEELQISRLINGVNNRLTIKLNVYAGKQNSGRWFGKMLALDSGPNADKSLLTLRRDHRKAIEQGIESALTHGPSFGYPMIDCDILLLQFQANGRCSLPVISSAASQCVMNALKRCSPILLEPISFLEVVSPREFNGAILGDLNQRRANILNSTARDRGTLVIKALVPLSCLSDYSEFLRIQTSGRASFSMELHNYSPMSEVDKHRHVKHI